MAGLFAGGAMAQGTGIWEHYKLTDEFTDEVTHHLLLVAEEVSTRASINISCQKNKTRFVITSKHVFKESRDKANAWEADYRIDKLTASKFKVFSTGASIEPFEPNKPIIKSLFNHDKLLVRYQTNDGLWITVRFKITGIETKIKPIREACNW